MSTVKTISKKAKSKAKPTKEQRDLNMLIANNPDLKHFVEKFDLIIKKPKL